VWQFFLALTLYGLGTLLWIVILVDVPLTRAYPFMALAFALVPVGAHFIYRETVQPSYWLGIAFLLIGMYIISTSHQ
jgi:drug/metabolite transporter (DMT)-like permease